MLLFAIPPFIKEVNDIWYPEEPLLTLLGTKIH